MPACLQIPLSGHDPLAFSLSYEGGGKQEGTSEEDSSHSRVWRYGGTVCMNMIIIKYSVFFNVQKTTKIT